MRTAVLVLAMALLSSALHGQRLPPPLPVVQAPAASAPRLAPPDDPFGAVLGSAIGGVAGMLAVGAVYSRLNVCTGDDCGGGLQAILLGLPLGAGLGAWIGNGRRGDVAGDMLGTVAVSGLVLIAGMKAPAAVPLALVLPAADLAAATIIERTTGAARAPRDSITVQRER